MFTGTPCLKLDKSTLLPLIVIVSPCVFESLIVDSVKPVPMIAVAVFSASDNVRAVAQSAFVSEMVVTVPAAVVNTI